MNKNLIIKIAMSAIVAILTLPVIAAIALVYLKVMT